MPRDQVRTSAGRVATAPAPAPPAAAPAPPKPEPPRKEMVIAWNASLLYLLEDGKPIGKPFIINASEAQFLRAAHLGDFRITEKIREWRSNLFDVHGKPLPDKSMAETDGAVMRNWMRLGNLAVGLHYSPAFHFYKDPEERHRSHGCYRMAKADSDFVFKWAPLGTPIHVVRSLAGTKWAFLREVTPARLLAHARSGGADTPKRRKHRRHRAEGVNGSMRQRPAPARPAIDH